MKQRIAALSLCVALVTACGTNAPDTEPTPSPTVHEVDPIAGLPGTQVTLEGSGLGGSGVLLLGDLEVAATAWSAESVTFTVPQEAAPAWQDLRVRPASGGEAQARFFVGHAFSGAPEELQAALDDAGPGAHVLLPPGVIAMPGQELVVDRVHLYGHPDGTTMALDPGGGVVVATGVDGAAGLADVTLEGAHVTLRPMGPRSLEPAPLVPTQEGTTDVTFERLSFTGASFGTPPGSAAGLGRLALLDSRVVVTGEAELTALDELVLRGTHLAGHEVRLSAAEGDAAIEGSTVVGYAVVDVGALAELGVVGSTLRAEDGNVTVQATGRQLSEPTVLGRLAVRASVVEAVAKAPVNGVPNELAGVARLGAWGGALELLENERIAASERVEVELWGPGDEGSYLRVVGNAFRSGRDVTVTASSENGPLEVSGNAVEVGSASEDARAEVRLFTDGTATVAENVIEGAGEAEIYVGPRSYEGETGPGVITGNRVTMTEGGDGDVWLDSEKPCLITDNVVVAGDPSEARGHALVRCVPEDHPGGEATVARNDIASSTGILLVFYDLDKALVEQNRFSVPNDHMDIDTDDLELVFSDNRVTANHPLLSMWDEGVATLTRNEFRLSGDDPRGIEVWSLAKLTMTENTFAVEGEPTDRGVAFAGRIRYGAETELDVRRNTFTGFGAAVLLEVSDSEATGAIKDNVFDFPMSSPGQGGHFIAVDATVVLDMTMNRWGDITDVDEVFDVLLIEQYGTSRVVVSVGPIRTD